MTLIDSLIGREGGYSNNPSDAGGETMWGITATTARAHGYSGPMAAMPRQIAVEIYLQRYVIDPGFGQVHALSPRLAEELVDTGVNMGPKFATTTLQRFLAALNRQGRDYPDLTVDGVLGAATLSALKTFLAQRGPRGEQVLLAGLNCVQGARYLELAESRPANEDFLFGWLNARVAG
jgi:lysozyme family protein